MWLPNTGHFAQNLQLILRKTNSVFFKEIDSLLQFGGSQCGALGQRLLE